MGWNPARADGARCFGHGRVDRAHPGHRDARVPPSSPRVGERAGGSRRPHASWSARFCSPSFGFFRGGDHHGTFGGWVPFVFGTLGFGAYGYAFLFWFGSYVFGNAYLFQCATGSFGYAYLFWFGCGSFGDAYLFYSAGFFRHASLRLDRRPGGAG